MFFHCSHTRQRWNLFSTILNGNMTTKSIWRLLYWQRHFLLELFPAEKPPRVISIWKTEPHWWKHCLTLILQGNLFSSRKFSHSSSHACLRKRSSGQKRASQKPMGLFIFIHKVSQSNNWLYIRCFAFHYAQSTHILPYLSSIPALNHTSLSN